MSVHLCLLGLLSFVTLAGVLQSSRAHPAFSAPEAPLKREKRAWGCSEVALGDTLRDWKHAPEALESVLQAVQTNSPEDTKWSHFVQVFEGKGAKEAGGKVDVCKGWMEGEQWNDVVLVKQSIESAAQVQYIIFSTVPVPSLSRTLTVWFSCADSSTQCFRLLLKGSKSRVRRDVEDTHSSNPHTHSSHTSNGVKWGVGVCVSVAGLIGFLATLAMCAHSSQAYEPPDVPKLRILKTSEVLAAGLVGTSEPLKSDSQLNLLNNGSMSEDPSHREQATASSEAKSSTDSHQSSESKLLSSQRSGSQDPLIPSENKARNKDHLPGMPTLNIANIQKENGNRVETEEAGQDGGYASVTKPHTKKGGYSYVDKVGDAHQNEEDEAGYAYATVGGTRAEGPVKPAEVGDGNGHNNKDKGSALLPYGKVTRHIVPVSHRGSYNEVRTTASPMLPPGRPRAVTEPVEPSADRKGGMSASTESAAHLPLPQIPNLEVNEDTYDSIPEELRENAASGGASVANSKDIPLLEEVKDETMEEGEEDMYESVPEDIRQTVSPSSPVALSPSSLAPPPPRSPSRTLGHAEASASPSHQLPPAKKDTKDEDEGKKKGKEDDGKKKALAKSEQRKHKVLSKAKSDSSTDSRGRSLSSFFARKKGASVVDNPPSPKLKNEKYQHEPLPQIPAGVVSSPTHLLPPTIPAPLPPDDEDDTPDRPYDMINVLNPRGTALLRDAKNKSASLPTSMRTAGASVFHPVVHGPLPDVPEESSGGLVCRNRVKETMDPEYDTVVLGQVENEPNYDSVTFPNVENPRDPDAMPKLEPAGPGGAEAGPGRGQTPTKYAKVTSHTAVENAVSPELSAHPPEHDDLGYAVIPAHLKMRKRAMSDALKKEKVVVKSRSMSDAALDDPEYDTITPSQAAVDEASWLDALQSPTEPEYESVTDEMRESVAQAGEVTETPYASVDMAAKRRSQMIRQQSGGDCALDSPSPNPPPLPQQGDLGDLSEFHQPPIPAQLPDSLKLIEQSDSAYSEVLQPRGGNSVVNPYSQIDLLQDPPYDAIKRKSENGEDNNKPKEATSGKEDENPYATVGDIPDELEAIQSPNDPPYAKINKGKVLEDEEDPGYENTGLKLPVENEEEKHSHEDDDEGTYDRLDHGFGNAAACRTNLSTRAVSPGGGTESTTVIVDFQNSTSPELIVTPADGTSSEVNGVSGDTEEKTIDFTD